MRSSLHPLTWAIVALFCLGTACTKAAEPGHEGHDHAAGEGHGHDDGEPHPLGTPTLGAAQLKVVLMGEVEAGHEAVLEVALAGGTPPSVLRAWVGIESGKGSVKAVLGKEEDGWHGHFGVPATLPEGSAIWVEADAEDGTSARTSFPIPAEGHEHDHEGHDHGEKKAKPEAGHEGHNHKH